MQSKLNWSEVGDGDHAGVLNLYIDFRQLRVRKLQGSRRGQWRAEQLSDSAFGLRYQLASGQVLLVLAQLVPAVTRLGLDNKSILQPTHGHTWNFVLSTNEPKYGGEQPGLWDPAEKQFVLTEPEVIVFLDGQP